MVEMYYLAHFKRNNGVQDNILIFWCMFFKNASL